MSPLQLTAKASADVALAGHAARFTCCEINHRDELFSFLHSIKSVKRRALKRMSTFEKKRRRRSKLTVLLVRRDGWLTGEAVASGDLRAHEASLAVVVSPAKLALLQAVDEHAASLGPLC